MRLGVLLRRELALGWSGGGGPLLAIGFYLGVATLLALAVGVTPQARIGAAAGAAWIALALSSLLALERLFARDYEDGALDLLVLGRAPLELVCAVKCLAQWLALSAPLAMAAPVVAIALGVEARLAPLIFACALLGGLGFCFTGGLGAALAVSSKRGGLLIAAIVLPLFAPPVIFGAGAIEAAASGADWVPAFLFLAAYALVAVALSPIAMAAAVRGDT